MRNVTLILEDGTKFHGQSFGYDAPAAGEVVFNTAMTGYPESLSDPSYAGQILVLTYPLVGNYGVPPLTKETNGLSSFLESERIQVSALIVTDYSEDFSHWNATKSLGEWLKEEKVTGITGVDTRELTKALREHGVMTGRIVFDDNEESKPEVAYEGVNFVKDVSCKEVVRYNEGADKKVVVVDCGVRSSIIRSLTKRNVEVIRVPWNYDFNTLEFDGLFLSNGPGDPNTLDTTVDHIKQFLADPNVRPCMGVCLGNQLLAKAAGASVYKLKYGHRGINQPVREVGTTFCYITPQNHGYAVDGQTLPEEWETSFVNMNDGSNEGIRHTSKPWFATQFNPENCCGPLKSKSLIDEFVKLL